MPLIDLPPGTETLGAMITPAVLISACGTLSLATANRLGRVVDRIRELSALAESLTSEPPVAHAEEKQALISSLMIVLARRMRTLQTSATLLYTAIGIFVATSLTLGLSLTAKWDYGVIPVAIGLLGATAMFAAVVFLVLETRLSVQSTLVEIEFTRRIVERATKAMDASRAPPPRA